MKYSINDDTTSDEIEAANPRAAILAWCGPDSKFDTGEMEEGEKSLIRCRDTETNKCIATATMTADGKGGVASVEMHIRPQTTP